MPGEDRQEQQQAQQSQTQPWAPAQPLLLDLLKKYQGVDPSVTAGQSSAIDKIIAGASGVPDFASDASGAVSDLFSSDTAPQIGMLNEAYGGLQKNLGGTASGAELDPYQTPGLSDALARVGGDITNRVKGVYAASGRDPSGAGSFAKTLGRGLTEGMAPIVVDQFNKNKANQMGAASTLYGAGNTTAGAITGQQQTPLQNAMAALGLLPQVSQAATLPGKTQLEAANLKQSQPILNLNSLLAPAAQIAGLGGQTSGTSTASTVQPQSTLSNIMGAATGGLGMLSMLFSDERLKEDVEPVGELYDGQPVYRYKYVDDPATTHIGLLAQEVADEVPESVFDIGGILAVEYGRATNRAAEMARAA